MRQNRCLKAASRGNPRLGASAQPAAVLRNGPALRFAVLALVAPPICAYPALGQNEPYLLKDINETGGSDSDPTLITDLGGIAYFVAFDPETGVELWRSDGTSDGTSVVADLNEGPGSTLITEMATSGGKLFFVANNWTGGQGAELWVHDPATGDTGIVVDLVEGPGSSSPSWLTDVDGTLFFAAYTEDAGVELWRSGGDAASTSRVRDLESGVVSSGPEWLTVCDGVLYFRAWTSSENWTLWRSDGTEAGTTTVYSATGEVSLNPTNLTAVGGKLFFLGEDEPHGNELWLHDPVAGTTEMVQDIHPGSPSSEARELTDVAGTLFFAAADDTHGIELWKSDGTQAGTVMVEDIYPGASDGDPMRLAAADGRVYFQASDGIARWRLWTSDGSPAPGTRKVEGFGATHNNYPKNLTEVGGKLFLTAYVQPLGEELWVVDAPDADARLVKEIYPGLGSLMTGPADFAPVGGVLFCSADDRTRGRELWSSDGTTFGTKFVSDINPGAGSHSQPRYFVVVGNNLFFSANSSNVYDRKLWMTDGTAFSTVPVRDSTGGVGNNSAGVAVDGIYYFQGADSLGDQLWRSDGTDEGTRMVEQISPYGTAVAELTDVGGTVFFTAQGLINRGTELWKSDGTELGTEMVADIFPGYFSSEPLNLVESGGKLFFTAEHPDYGRELWIHDPAGPSTELVKDVEPGLGSEFDYFGQELVALGGKVYFVAYSDPSGFELWASDGTQDGTGPVTTGLGIWPDAVVAAGGRLFFLAGDPFVGPTELWTSGGTQATTVKAKQIATGSIGTGWLQMTAAGNRVYFVLDDGVSGEELWVSDGTATGTHLVKDIAPGSESSSPRGLMFAQDIAGGSGLLFFSATDGTHGGELWVTDGTESGTRMVHDSRPGPEGSNPGPFAVMLNTLYFPADDGIRGQELWAYQFAADSDRDGLPDEWEREGGGYTHPNGQTVDLFALGARPDHRDLFVEVDHMAGTFDHEPHADAMAAIVAAFANAPVDNPDGETGIRLHINARTSSRSVLAFQDVLGTGPDPDHYDWTEFDALKAANFATELEWSHHYCIFAHKLPTGEGTDSGVSRGIAANDFIVALGAFTDRYGGQAWIDTQAGTFMHELGHNLGLGHGGTDNVNQKPNYLSIMNYSFIHRGLIHTDPSRRWDYSREALPDLDENQLNEGAGLGGTDPNYGTKYWCNLISEWVETAAGTALAWIDWNYSGIDESDADPVKLVPADLNKDLLPLVSGTMILPGYEAEEPLRGANDWERILFEAGRIGGGMAAPPQVTEADEIDRETSDEMRPDPLGKVKGHAAKSQIILTWQPAGPKNSGIRYNVYRNGGGSAGPIGDTDRSNFHDRNVVSGTTYVYSVTWVDAQGVESAPAEVTVTAK